MEIMMLPGILLNRSVRVKARFQPGLAEGTCVARDRDNTRPATESGGMTRRPAAGREDWGADVGSLVRIRRRAAGLTQQNSLTWRRSAWARSGIWSRAGPTAPGRAR